jgi:hypothetical protein
MQYAFVVTFEVHCLAVCRLSLVLITRTFSLREKSSTMAMKTQSISNSKLVISLHRSLVRGLVSLLLTCLSTEIV